jgi:hypothetical protein
MRGAQVQAPVEKGHKFPLLTVTFRVSDHQFHDETQPAPASSQLCDVIRIIPPIPHRENALLII